MASEQFFCLRARHDHVAVVRMVPQFVGGHAVKKDRMWHCEWQERPLRRRKQIRLSSLHAKRPGLSIRREVFVKAFILNDLNNKNFSRRPSATRYRSNNSKLCKKSRSREPMNNEGDESNRRDLQTYQGTSQVLLQ
jgi:hypothetical protein